MDLPGAIAGLDARRVRDVFKNLLAQERDIRFENGIPVSPARRISTEFIEAELKVSATEAVRIQQALIEEGWILPIRFIPTRQGMGLAQHVDRPKLNRAAAEAILEQVLDWADRVNAQDGARVKVRNIHLYGSLMGDASEVGDIDLFIDFTTMDLDDLQPEDMESEDELCDQLNEISDYISPSCDLTRLMMNDVPTRKVFPRNE
jgi:hypothetical protein